MLKNIAASAFFVSFFMIQLQAAPGDIVFPASTPGVIDITKAPYSADNTGKTDVSAILSRACQNERDSSAFGMKIVYLPSGTYLVKNTVAWKTPPYTIGPHMVGQSRKGTVIKLADNTFTDSLHPKYVVSTGDGVAQCFNRGLANLTVHTGKGNPGAIGVHWYGNNEALMTDIDIISGDGRGEEGMDLRGNEEGPAMARRIYIKGFRVGIRSDALNAITLAEISLENQSWFGIINEYSPLWIDSLYSVNSRPAVINRSGAYMVLVNARLNGGKADTPAVLNEGSAFIFARDIVCAGYQKAIGGAYAPNAPLGLTIKEYASRAGKSLFNSPLVSLNLPVKRAPEPVWESDLTKWANMKTYKTGSRTDAQALQAAIDDPAKTVVYIPRQTSAYSITETVYIRGAITMIVGCGGSLDGSGNGQLVLPTSASSPRVVKLLKIGTSNSSLPIVQQSDRTLILESVLCGVLKGQGTGDVFATDFVNRMEITGANQHAWLWHYNMEGGGTSMSAGTVRMFGWKTEHSGTQFTTTGGTLELLGMRNYAPCGDHSGYQVFSLTNTNACIIAFDQMTFCNACYPWLVRDVRNGVTKDLKVQQNNAGFNLPLYTSYDNAMIQTSTAPQSRGIRPVALEKPVMEWYTPQGQRVRNAADFKAFETAPGVLISRSKSTDRIARMILVR